MKESRPKTVSSNAVTVVAMLDSDVRNDTVVAVLDSSRHEMIGACGVTMTDNDCLSYLLVEHSGKTPLEQLINNNNLQSTITKYCGHLVTVPAAKEGNSHPSLLVYHNHRECRLKLLYDH